MRIKLDQIASIVGGRLSPSSDPDRVICGFFSDSRTPASDKLFLALRGERVDGNSFVPSLLERDFAAMVDNENYVPTYGSCVIVDDVRDSLQRLAVYYRKNELNGVRFIGITGSVGKTTTKDMVALAFAPFGKVHKTPGNSNSQIGVPQTVLDIAPDTDFAIVELGMSMPGEMEKISRCAMPDVSIITNIGYSHIENLGSREAIRDEKIKIISFSPDDSLLIINGDEDIWTGADFMGKRTLSVSSYDKNACCYVASENSANDGLSFTVHIEDSEVDVRLSVRGDHYIINTLFALTAVSALGLDCKRAAISLAGYESDGRRQYVYEKDGHRIISDCYNASPESMRASLSVLSSYNGRRIAVLGDMLELGEYSESLHREVGEMIEGKADILVTYGEKARYIAESAVCDEKYSFKKTEREELRLFLSSLVCVGDTVLYKGSNGMNLAPLIV